MKNKLTASITAAIVALSVISVSSQAAIFDDGEEYRERVIYDLDLSGADTSSTVTSSNTEDERAILMTGQPPGLAESNIFCDIGGVNSDHTYGVVKEDNIKENDEILKLTATAASSSSYVDIKTQVASDDFYIDDDGFLSVSFNFYANGSYIDIRTGRTIGEDAQGAIHMVKGEGQRILGLTSDAKLVMFGPAYGETIQLPMYSDAEHINYGQDHQWHNIEIIMSGDNRYKVVFDGEELNDGQWFIFDTVGIDDQNVNCTFGDAEGSDVSVKFRGFSTLRLYNGETPIGGEQVTSAVNYFDNFRYVVYDNITESYVPPTVRFSDPTDEVIDLEEGEKYTFKIEAETLYPDKINVYVDDVLEATFDGASCEYEYTASVGTHTVSAEAVDSIGTTSERCSVTVNVPEETIPHITAPDTALNGSSFDVQLEADSYNGIVAAALYDTYGVLQSIKLYPADEYITVSFDDGSIGAYAKIMWWDDVTSMKSVCGLQTVTMQ